MRGGTRFQGLTPLAIDLSPLGTKSSTATSSATFGTKLTSVFDLKS